MVGMLQIITWLLGVYLVMKGVEILQIGLASGREKRVVLLVIGGLSIVVCAGAAFVFVGMQDQQAMSLSHNSSFNPSAGQGQ